MNEIWRSVIGYEGLYEVNNIGRARNPRTGKLLKPYKDKYGYLCVNLYKDGIRKNYFIHRLVAQSFLPNPDNLPQVNHKDENKENNCVENLEWCDGLYNNNYGKHIERVAKAQSKTVYMLTLDSKLCGLWPSARECDRNGFGQSAIAKCCNGKLKKYKGFKWSYEPPKPPKALPYSIA